MRYIYQTLRTKPHFVYLASKRPMGFQSSYTIPEFIDSHSTPKPLSTP
ncbi:hypothetical protein T05_9596 [Trichinella murrelli]|uniref:Uncharacterized protein n=1 Tax=Trichinella murrelli TaxID=144512 RepID=A0A0V0SYY4_9BILA|nr:hypothetical protein T05_12964 [Trichinella murrelli]KRX32383.1 hypothetical protein T05_9596 [Trichinella murrelli]